MRENEERSQPGRVGAFAGADQRQQRVRLSQAAPCAFVSVAFALDGGCSSCEARQDAFLAKNFEHFVKPGADGFAAYGDARRVYEVSGFDAERVCGFFQLRLDSGMRPIGKTGESFAKRIQAFQSAGFSQCLFESGLFERINFGEEKANPRRHVAKVFDLAFDDG